MRRHKGTAALVMGAVLITGCAGGGGSPAGGTGSFTVTSTSFRDGSAIPKHNARAGAGGEDLSIPLAWSGAPADTASFAIAMVDVHPIARGFVHWLVTDVPAHPASLPEGASGSSMPAGAVEHRNDFGSIGYGGPQPPPGSGPHDYRTTVYALDVAHLDVPPGSSLATVERGMAGHVLAEARLTGTYER